MVRFDRMKMYMGGSKKQYKVLGGVNACTGGGSLKTVGLASGDSSCIFWTASYEDHWSA